jgi:hypothetical protein
MSITPSSPLGQGGRVRTWVSSRWKNPWRPGQFSVEINTYLQGHVNLDDPSITNNVEALKTYKLTWVLFLIFFTMRSAFLIHLWLPLFALSSLLVKLVFWIFRAVEWAQWFLKQGDAHPFRAIGIVATIIVFGTAMLVKEGWTVL